MSEPFPSGLLESSLPWLLQNFDLLVSVFDLRPVFQLWTVGIFLLASPSETYRGDVLKFFFSLLTALAFFLSFLRPQLPLSKICDLPHSPSNVSPAYFETL